MGRERDVSRAAAVRRLRARNGDLRAYTAEKNAPWRRLAWRWRAQHVLVGRAAAVYLSAQLRTTFERCVVIR